MFGGHVPLGFGKVPAKARLEGILAAILAFLQIQGERHAILCHLKSLRKDDLRYSIYSHPTRTSSK